MNAPLMASLRGTKDIIDKFIISQYHNEKLYSNIPMEISVETIYKLTRISNKGDPVLVGIKEGLLKRLIGTPSRKKFKGLIVNHIKASTPKKWPKSCPQG